MPTVKAIVGFMWRGVTVKSGDLAQMTHEEARRMVAVGAAARCPGFPAPAAAPAEPAEKQALPASDKQARAGKDKRSD
jgi:hypothetical protein